MPDLEKILSLDLLRITVDVAADIVGENSSYFDDLINYSLLEKKTLSLNATRVIEIIITKKRELFFPYANLIAEKYPTFKTDGLKRMYPKILGFATEKISDENKIILLETCFKYLLSEREALVVRVNCMDLIYKISQEIPEIKGELQASLEFIYDQSAASIQARATKILSKLK